MVNHATEAAVALFALDGRDVCAVGVTAFGVPLPAQPALPALMTKPIASVKAHGQPGRSFS
jgi:hypothetical protein